MFNLKNFHQIIFVSILVLNLCILNEAHLKKSNYNVETQSTRDLTQKKSVDMIRGMVEMLFEYNELLESNLPLNPNKKKLIVKNYIKLKNSLQQYMNENQQNAKILNDIISDIMDKKKLYEWDGDKKLNIPFKWG